MQSQQIGEYIAEQLRAGHSEAVLKEHLLNHGWSQTAVNQAFNQHYHADVEDIKPVKRSRRTYRPHWWRRARRLKLAVASMVIVTLAAASFTILHQTHEQNVPVQAAPMSYQVKQSIDVATVAGFVVQYAVANGGLPLAVAAQPDGGLILCGAICDNAGSELSGMLVYKSANIHVRTYEAGLTAPDKHTIYLIPQAKCAEGGAVGEINTNPRSMVLLYQRVSGNSLVPRCVTM